MKKQEQTSINEAVLYHYNKYISDETQIPYNTHRLRPCSACVYYTDDYIVLQSYATVIAIIDRKTMILYDFLRYVYGYTATSVQHLAKFRKDYKPVKTYSYYDV